MRLRKLLFQLLDNWYTVELDAEPGELLRPITGRLGLTLITGPNGSGKTSILSSLVRLFHHADWQQDKIRSDFGVWYTLEGSDIEMSLAHFDGNVSIGQDGNIRQLADSSVTRRATLDTTLASLLPFTICSAFSTRGEYPNPKPRNARGHKNTAIYNIATLYGDHHYSIGSLSAGIRRLLSPEFQDARLALAKVTGLKIGKHVKVHPTRKLLDLDPNTHKTLEQFDWDPKKAEWHRATQRLPWLSRDWIRVTRSLLKTESDGLIYINDVMIDNTTIPAQGSLMSLSAGQKMLLVRLLSILSSITDNSLVVAEEPELHLDPLWCGSLLELLGVFFGRFSAHVVLTTHNLSLLRCFPSHCVVFTSTDQALGNHKTFLASESIVGDLIYRQRSLTSLDERILKQLGTMQDTAARQKVLDTLGEGPVRFLGRRELMEND